MKALTKRLQSLEGGRHSSYDLWSDAQLIERMNELSLELLPYGFDFPLLDGGPGDVDKLRVTEKMITQSIGAHHAQHQATH